MTKETAAQLKDALDAGTITEREHQALYMHFVQGLSYRQIGDGLTPPISRFAVRDRVRSALRKMTYANERNAA